MENESVGGGVEQTSLGQSEAGEGLSLVGADGIDVLSGYRARDADAYRPRTRTPHRRRAR